MTVADLRNLSVLDSSFHRESQSPLSRWRGNHDKPGTRASSLLQMWRKLEGQHVVCHPQSRVEERPWHGRIDDLNADLVNSYLSAKQECDDGDRLEDGTKNSNECEAQNEHEDGKSSSSGLSTDIGEAERGRVRQIFQEWMNSGGARSHASNASSVNNYSRAEWLGENECERVRIIREWVTMTTSQQRGTCTGSKEEQTAEIGAQIERVRDGFVVDHCEIGTRRNIRRLCGRQALLDLLARAERERKAELQILLEHQHVTDFAHRNRIQSLLRGRFLQSGRLLQNERPSSLAASELGLLRQRHNVSGLREGFLSRSDNFVNCPSRSEQSDTSSNNDINHFMNKKTETNSSQEDLAVIEEQSEFSNGERDINGLSTVPLEGHTDQDINYQEATALEEQIGIFQNEESERLTSANSVRVGSRDGLGGNGVGNWGENIANAWSKEASRNVGKEQHHLLGAQLFREQNEPIGEEHHVNASSNHPDGNESNAIEDMHSPHTFAQIEEWQESVTDNSDSDWQLEDNIEFTGPIDDNGEGRDGNWSERTADQWYQDTLGSEGEEYDTLQELHEGWHDSDLHEDMDMLEGPSARQAAPVGRFDTFSFQDDNMYSSEIRELLSRKSVSNLLRSDFRESLEHVIQSYVERQEAHASVDWEELDGVSSSPSSPALMEQDVWQSGGQNEGQLDAAQRDPLFLPSPPVTPSRPFWDQALQDDNWSRNNLQQHSGLEWETINDLRIDMARLQQRMDEMQRMLEACMDMQLELQRSVRQEISAALNRSACSTEKDESKWDHVRRGLCCIYCDSSIDSLLYRCGHMCTCSKCAEKLVQGKGKCPMCRAPVVEMIHSYSIQ